MFLFLPYHVDVPMQRIPWANWVLIAVTSLVSLAGIGANREFGSDAWMWKWCLHRENFRLYQLLTFQLVHADVVHLFLNMYFLFLFGNAVNAKIGHARFLSLYFALGAFTGLVWALTDSADMLLGASGAVCVITGMFLILYPLNEVAVFYGWYVLRTGDMGVMYMSSIWLILAYIVYDLTGCFLWSHEPIAYISHLTGYFLGIAAAVALLLGGWIKPAEGEETLLQYLNIHGPAAKQRRRKKRRSLIRRQPGAEELTEQQSPGTSWTDWNR
jgi:membrane associated rhomboid family serine protease